MQTLYHKQIRFVNSFRKMAKSFVPQKTGETPAKAIGYCRGLVVGYKPKPRSLYAAARVFAFSMT